MTNRRAVLLKMHKLPPPEELRQVRERLVTFNASRREHLRTAQGRTAARYRGLFETLLHVAGLAIALELDDDVIRAEFKEAVDVAQLWLAFVEEPATESLRSTSVEATREESGQFSFATRPQAPSGPPPGFRETWHVGIMSNVLDVLTAFGSLDEARTAAAAGEEWYRNPEVVAEEAYFADVRARKHWLLSDDTAATQACREAVRLAPQTLHRPASGALLALMDRDAPAFHAALADVLKMHKRVAGRGQAEGIFSIEGLALGRMARTYGIEVEEQTYLPMRFLAPGPIRTDAR